MTTEETLNARIALLEEELRSCDCTTQCCSKNKVNPNCTTHRYLPNSTNEWLDARLALEREAELTKTGRTVRCIRDTNWLDSLGDHRDVPEPLTREAIRSALAKVREDERKKVAAFVKSKVAYNMIGGSVWQWPPSQSPPFEQILALGGTLESLNEPFSPRIAQLELALKMALELADSTDDDLPTSWRQMRDEAGAALDATTTGKWLEKHDAQVLGKTKAELDELQVSLKQISEEEFLRRAMAMDTENRDNLTPLGKMLVGLHKKAEGAFLRGHDAALSASTSCTNCDSPGHYRPNGDEALCGECMGDEIKLAELMLQHLAEDGGALMRAIRPETKQGERLKEWAMKATEHFKKQSDELKAKYLEAVQIRKDAIEEFTPYASHLGSCCRGLPSALRPCNCGLFDLLGPISDREAEKRAKHKEEGPFPNRELINDWIKRTS